MFQKPIVSVEWLYDHLDDENLMVLDATLPKVNSKEVTSTDKKQIKGAAFFDIKNTFSDTRAPFPNTTLSSNKFEICARNLGIDNSSVLVVYDDLGIYSSPRVWWMFQLMGFTNIAVLDGGLPAWKAKNYPIQNPKELSTKKGDFIASYQSIKIKTTADVLLAIGNPSILTADARSKARFWGTAPEPRKEVRSGHIPHAVSLPYTTLLEQGEMKAEEDLKTIFFEVNPTKKELIFSCGTGITACILALGASLSGIDNYAVYDDSWTAWGSTPDLPISI